MIQITEVRDLEVFFSALLSLFASQRVILTVWGTIPIQTKNLLVPYSVPQGRIRKQLFRESNLYLSKESKESLIQHLGKKELLKTLSFGIRKGTTPLCLCRDWNDITLDRSDIISDSALMEWLDDQKNRGVINFQKISD